MTRCCWLSGVVTALGILVFVSASSAQTPPVAQSPAPSSQAAPPRDASAQPRTATAIVRGRITAAASDQPLHRVRITLTGQNPTPPTTVTDMDGVFELTNVPAGSYSITAARAGYLPAQYGQRRPQERGRTVVVRDGDVVEHVEIALQRAGVLSGRVFDESGDPYPGVRVEAIELRYTRGRRVPLQAGMATTNDLGEFRVGGLTPGTYQLRASTTETWEDDDKKKGTHAYAVTYFPGTPGTEMAQTISVAAGQEVPSLDVTFVPGRAVRIGGVLQDSSGQPLPMQAVHLDRITRGIGGALVSASAGGSTRSDSGGAFELRGIPPGEYLLYSGSTETEHASQPLIVADADVTGIVLTPRKASTLRGSVVTDEGQPTFPASRVQISLISVDENSVLPAWEAPRPQTVGSDWSFRLFLIMDGRFLLRPTGLPDDWILKAVRINDRDITDTPLEVSKGGAEMSGVQIFLTRQAAKVSGEVVDGRGAPRADSTVLVFAADSRLWGIGTRFVKVIRPDVAGHFTVGGLPAGRYLAIARDDVADGQWEDPDFLRTLSADASKIEIGEGATGTITLTIKPEPR